jgi:branched-chain amino acid transport system permease protein
MITTAFGMLLWTVIRKWSSLTGGDDGLTGVNVPELLNSANNAYFFTLIVVSACLLVLWIIVNSPFGWTLRAIRENPNRCAFTNINVISHRYIAFVIASFFTGIAGSLFVVYSHSTFPDYCYWIKSGDMIAVVILGGMFSFLGPLVGAGVFIVLQTSITSLTLYWPLIMGAIICAVVLIMPDGVMGFTRWVAWKEIGKQTVVPVKSNK